MHLSRPQIYLTRISNSLLPGDGERWKDQTERRKARRLDAPTLSRYDSPMEESKRATIYFEADVHRALRLRAAACNRSISDMVNEAVRITLAQDADDLRDSDQRQAEESCSFEEFVTSLRNSGRI